MEFATFVQKKLEIFNSKNYGILKDISEDLDLERDDKEIEMQNSSDTSLELPNGYLGEMNYDPNPYEYGPDATYRKEGTVYKKSVDNLWEVYLRDGKQGAQGPKGFAGGSGVGVQEARSIAIEIATSAISGITSSNNQIDRYLTISQILNLNSVSGTFMYPSDKLTAKLIYDGSKWNGNYGIYTSLSSLETLTSSSIAVGSYATISNGYSNNFAIFNGYRWLLSNGEEIIIPSTPANVDVSQKLQNIISNARIINKKVILNDHYINNQNIFIYDKSNVEFRGIISANNGYIFLQGSDITINGLTISGGGLRLGELCNRCNIYNTNINFTSAYTGIEFKVTSDNQPTNILIQNARIKTGAYGVLIYGALNSIFSNIFIHDCDRAFTVYSSENCIFNDIFISGDTRVGFLNISRNLDTFGRGNFDNKLTNICVSGFREEGISYDCNVNVGTQNSSIVHTYISAKDTNGIYLSSNPGSTFYYPNRYQIIFMTGKLAGECYDIVSANNNYIHIKDFYNNSFVEIGDFISIEIKCRNNVYINPMVNGSTDPTGMVFWGFGYGTTIQNGIFNNSTIEVASICNNMGLGGLNGNTNFVCPSKLNFNNIKFFGKGDYETFDSWIYSGIKVHLYTGWYKLSNDWYNSSASPSTSLPPDKMFIYDINITNCDFKISEIDNALRMNIFNNRGTINYTSCKNVYDYTHPTFINDKIIISSASELSAFGGYIGQTLVCKDQNFQKEGAIFDWEPSLSAWEIRPGQYISQNYPTSSDSVFVFSATSADVGLTKLIKIGTIPANIAHSGRTMFNADAIVEANSGVPSTFLSILYLSGNNLPLGAQFSVSTSSTRSMFASNALGVQCEGSSLIADKVRQLGGNNNGSPTTIVVDFTKDVPVYIAIITPTSGVNYTVRRSWIKTGLN